MAFAYDSHGRVVRTAHGSRAWDTTYDASGNIATETDPLGRTTSYEYDPDGKVTAVNMPDSRRAEYQYDGNDNLVSVKPPSRPEHIFAYNLLDLATAYDAPPVGAEPHVTSYAYDTDKRLTGLTRPDGKQIDLSFDAGGHVSQIQEPGATTSFTYDSRGLLSSASSTEGTSISFTTDGSLPTSQSFSGATSGTVSQSYDDDLRLSATTAAGNTASYDYDADSLLTQAGAMSIARDTQTGLPSQLSLGALTTTNTFDSYAELAREHTAAGAAELFDAQYTRDQVGRIQSKTETSPSGTTSWSYVYDATGRLAQVSKNGQPHATYAYDQQGNRLSETDAQGNATYATYDDQDRLVTYGQESFAYNAAGELTTRTNTTTGDTTTYAYNAFGNLTDVELPGGTQIAYELDPFARRVAKKKDGQVEARYLYGPEAITPVAQLDAQGDLVARFVYGTSSHVPEYVVKGANTYRLVTDQLGSVRLVVDASTGSVVQEIAYDAFGGVTQDTNPGFQPFYFAGGLYDEDTGLVHFGEREYDARLGRFTSVDPIGFGGGQLNLHAYVMGDPVNYVDPSGTISLDDASNAVAGFGDAASLGASAKVREWINGGCDPVDRDSGWYKGGDIAGEVASTVSGFGGTARAVQTAYKATKYARSLAGPKRANEVRDEGLQKIEKQIYRDTGTQLAKEAGGSTAVDQVPSPSGSCSCEE
jgi:RHS repeat-associated protein